MMRILGFAMIITLALITAYGIPLYDGATIKEALVTGSIALGVVLVAVIYTVVAVVMLCGSK